MKRILLLILALSLTVVSLVGQASSQPSSQITAALTSAANDMAVLVEQNLSSVRGPQALYLRGIIHNNTNTQLGELFSFLLLSRISSLGLDNLKLYGTEVRPPVGTSEPYYIVIGNSMTLGDSVFINISLKKMPENQTLKVVDASLPASTELNRLLVAQGAAPGDDYEPNNSPDMAYPLEGNTRIDNLNIEPAGDVDWFSINITRPVTLRIGTEGSLDTKIYVYGPDSPSREIAYDDDGGSGYNALVNSYFDAPGIYYIQVKCYDSDERGNYSLFVEEIHIALDADEPNNTKNEAKRLDISSLPRDLSLFPSGDRDWYQLDLSSFLYREGEVLEFYTTGDLDTYMDLYRGNELILSGDDDASYSGDYNAKISFSPLRGETYYLLIRGYDDSIIGEYQLHTQTVIVQQDRYEPNNSRETATRININETQRGHKLSPYDTVDWFVFEVTAPGNVTIVTEGALDTLMNLYDNRGEHLYEDDDSGEDYNARLDVSLQRGTYFVEVTQYYNDDGEYSISVTQ